jgi:acyl-CoA dehydrogenase
VAARGDAALLPNAGRRRVQPALGTSDETPLAALWQLALAYGIWDGPTEAHVTTTARQVLKDYLPSPGLWPTEWIPARLERARERYAGALAEQAAWAAPM